MSPCQRKAGLREFFNGRLSNKEFVKIVLPQIAKIVQTSQLMYEKCRNKSGEIRREAVKNGFIELCGNILGLFPHFQENLLSL